MDRPAYPLVDLLQHKPEFRIDPVSTDTKIVFCFSGSTTGGLFADTLARARLPESTWDPECYQKDLFVDRFVYDCLKGALPLVTFTHLARLISRPPGSAETVTMRRDILRELSLDATLRSRFETLHASLSSFRGALEGTDDTGQHRSHRQQLDTLEHFSELVEQMAEGFGSAHSSLRRLAEFGENARSQEGFQSLLSLLSYDGKQATLDFRVRIGADGRVAHLSLLKVEEATENPFVTSPLKRWGAKFELLFRGFRFSDGEVMARLLDAVFEGVRPYFVTLVQLLGDLEFYLGALHLKARAEAAGLSMCLPEFCAPGEPRSLTGLFNPLLLSAGIRPVPCSINTDRHNTTLLITGPNSGGKTRLLQAMGLCQLLGQSGLFVPAESATIAGAPGLVVSLIQETTADQTEGRLGMELVRIRALFEQLPAGAIVILDELCSGTNPSEGEEIFELVIRMLAKLKPQAFITTHFLKFASRLKEEGRIEGLRFLQVALGPDQEPTYQFTPGVATTSLANHAAARLGVTGENLMALIEKKLAAQGS